ncbi:hypothetical protein NDU88_001521 [Pleurodeles waltl]|uniref:Secreted protein n=1 Tax=Pleurodeles waltl TaxID=8319 RepID=A0AAV7VZR3_PLEWA|nr:hypothetical protein NDU88_001521 [Pleurodeles waltl]
MAWAYFCWRDGGGLVIAIFSLTFGVADFCGCRVFGGFQVAGQNDRGGLPRPRRCYGGLLTGGGEYQETLSTRRHRAGCGSRVIVRSDGTLSLERRRQEREEAPLLVQTITSEASSCSGSPCVVSGLSTEGEAEVT